jgi:hypothetical protein
MLKTQSNAESFMGWALIVHFLRTKVVLQMERALQTISICQGDFSSGNGLLVD